jgi:hypothetical protein
MLRQRLDAHTVLHAKAVGVAATSWRHATARAVADQVPDPQLHPHVLLHAAHRRDGRLVAIDSPTRLQHQREVGAAYRSEFGDRIRCGVRHRPLPDAALRPQLSAGVAATAGTPVRGRPDLPAPDPRRTR